MGAREITSELGRDLNELEMDQMRGEQNEQQKAAATIRVDAGSRNIEPQTIKTGAQQPVSTTQPTSLQNNDHYSHKHFLSLDDAIFLQPHHGKKQNGTSQALSAA